MIICVFCSSSDAVGEPYASAADILGRLIGRGEHALVYGGSRFGLMGRVSAAARASGARVTAVIPRFMAERSVTDADELIVTETMHERKARMEALSDAFLALPGGFGTLEEVLEVITWCQLGLVRKPVALVNVSGFYENLLAQFQKLFADSFSKSAFRGIYGVADTPEAAMRYLEAWKPGELASKWF